MIDKGQEEGMTGEDLAGRVQSAFRDVEESRLYEKKYTQIVFLQNSQDFESFRGRGGKGEDGFFNSPYKEKAKFLSQWDYGSESEYDTRSKPSAGTHDTVVKINVPMAGKYILTYNRGLGYAGLEREVN